MEKFKSNFKKKEYDKEISLINQQYKGNSSQKEIILRKIKTSQEYEENIEKINGEIPEGLKFCKINEPELLKKTYDQIIKIAYKIDENFKSNNLLTNYRFYINTPYFDRNGSDPFPLFRLEDSRVSFISELVFRSLNLFGVNSFNKELLNIIVRIYRPGDVLNFHTDREIFGENIYGIVLHNKDPTRGLLLKTKKNSFVLNEEPGLIWNLNGNSRWDYEHGYCSNFQLKYDFIRISITFRFFQKESQYPQKDYEK